MAKGHRGAVFLRLRIHLTREFCAESKSPWTSVTFLPHCASENRDGIARRPGCRWRYGRYM